jgi:RNA polymerase sigma-70 factor, ECF subfamily
MRRMDEVVKTEPRTMRSDRHGEGPLAFEDFFRDEHDRLFRAVRLLTRDRQEAEELTQDAFLRVWERWGRVRVHGDPTGYLFRTALNLWRSRLRRAAVAARHVLHQGRSADDLTEVESRDVVVRALAGLPARQRAAIVLVDVLDLTSERAGVVLGIRPVSVRVLASRARATLARRLEERDG